MRGNANAAFPRDLLLDRGRWGLSGGVGGGDVLSVFDGLSAELVGVCVGGWVGEIQERAHADSIQGPADLRSAARTTEP